MRFHDSDLNQFRQAINQGLVVKAWCCGIPFAVTAINKQCATTTSWNIPLGKVTSFEIDSVASLGF